MEPQTPRTQKHTHTHVPLSQSTQCQQRALPASSAARACRRPPSVACIGAPHVCEAGTKGARARRAVERWAWRTRVLLLSRDRGARPTAATPGSSAQVRERRFARHRACTAWSSVFAALREGHLARLLRTFPATLFLRRTSAPPLPRSLHSNWPDKTHPGDTVNCIFEL